MTGRIYTASISITSLSAAKSLLLLEAPADLVLKLLRWEITNSSADSNEQHRGGLYRVTTKGSPAGTSVTPKPNVTGGTASSATVLGNLTTEPTTYETDAVSIAGFSNLNGWIREPLPGSEIIVPPSGLIGLRFLDAPSAGFNAVAEIEFAELGG